MNQRQLEHLQAEVQTLEALLASMGEGRIIERAGLESRLDEVREELKAARGRALAKRLPLTFRGAPVDGTRSIDAGFASSALRAFIEATDTVAASFTTELRGTGRLPGLQERSLRIVDTAQGSFGFELELPADPQIRLEPQAADPYEEAIRTTFRLLDQAADDDGDDEELSALVADMHPRAAAKVRAFAKILHDNDAQFAAEFDGRRVRLREPAAVSRVVDALRDEDITFMVQTLRGTLIGMLPDSRDFEAELEGGEIVKGKLHRGVDDIRSFKSTWEDHEALLVFEVVMVREKRRFTLKNAMPLPEDAEPSP